MATYTTQIELREWISGHGVIMPHRKQQLLELLDERDRLESAWQHGVDELQSMAVQRDKQTRIITILRRALRWHGTPEAEKSLNEVAKIEQEKR